MDLGEQSLVLFWLVQQPPGPGKPQEQKHAKNPCNCIALALPALKTQPPVMLSVLENPKTAEHEEQRSRRDEFKELLSLTDSRGWGSRGGTELRLGRISSTSHHPSPIQTTGLWECPLQGTTWKCHPPEIQITPIVGQHRNLLLPKPPEFLGFNYLACSLLGRKKKIWLIKLLQVCV